MKTIIIVIESILIDFDSILDFLPIGARANRPDYDSITINHDSLIFLRITNACCIFVTTLRLLVLPDITYS